jgi:hypothetical protein
MLEAIYLPWFLQPPSSGLLNGSSTNGNWGLAMAEAAMVVGVFTDTEDTFRSAAIMGSVKNRAATLDTLKVDQPNYALGNHRGSQE